jgi:hypothetical protein
MKSLAYKRFFGRWGAMPGCPEPRCNWSSVVGEPCSATLCATFLQDPDFCMLPWLDVVSIRAIRWRHSLPEHGGRGRGA